MADPHDIEGNGEGSAGNQNDCRTIGATARLLRKLMRHNLPYCFQCIRFFVNGKMAGVVPPDDNFALPIIAENAHECSVEKQQSTRVGRQAEPAGGENPQHMTVSKNDNVTFGRLDHLYDVVRASGHLGKCFATGWVAVSDRPTGQIFGG